MSREQKLIEQLKSWSTARLIPTLPESKKEERATSILLATFKVVPTFALDMLREVGAPTGKRVKIHCLTEIVPKTKDDSKLRPDGIVILDTGRSIWSAIVESKVGTNGLSAEKLQAYVDLARSLNCDAVITISNQFCAIPTHHPVPLPKNRLGRIGLFHFSWLSLVSRAVLLAEHKQVEDPEQAYILDELIRYLQHPKSGVSLMTEVGPGWKRTSEHILRGAKLLKSTAEVEQAVVSWHQLTRYLALELSIAVASPVSIHLGRKHANNPAERVKSHIDELVGKHTLTEWFAIPNAADRLQLTADFSRRALDFSMSVASPKDKKLASACINWLLNQIKVEDEDLMIRAYWPGRTPPSMAPVVKVREEPNCLVPEGLKSLPTSLEVVRVVDLAARFQQKRKFIEIAERELVRFYKDVGQHLRNWVPPAPKVKKEPKAPAEAVQEEIRISPFDSLSPYLSGLSGEQRPDE